MASGTSTPIANDRVSIEIKNKMLSLIIGDYRITTPGQYIPRADAQATPILRYPSASMTDTYMVVCLDFKSPISEGPILHWFQHGLRQTYTISDDPPKPSGMLDAGSERPLVEWMGPLEPANTGVHEYEFYLFQQGEEIDPRIWSLAQGDSWLFDMEKRFNFDLDAFTTEMKLAGRFVAKTSFTSCWTSWATQGLSLVLEVVSRLP